MIVKNVNENDEMFSSMFVVPLSHNDCVSFPLVAVNWKAFVVFFF